MKANFLAVGLVVRSTINEKEYLFTIYTFKKKKTKYINDIKYTINKFIMQSILHNKMLFYFFLFGIFFLIWHFSCSFCSPCAQLKARIVQLESQLVDERKKSEELQFSIDEAQFCGDEMNVRARNILPTIGEVVQWSEAAVEYSYTVCYNGNIWDNFILKDRLDMPEKGKLF